MIKPFTAKDMMDVLEKALRNLALRLRARTNSGNWPAREKLTVCV